MSPGYIEALGKESSTKAINDAIIYRLLKKDRRWERILGQALAVQDQRRTSSRLRLFANGFNIAVEQMANQFETSFGLL